MGLVEAYRLEMYEKERDSERPKREIDCPVCGSDDISVDPSDRRRFGRCWDCGEGSGGGHFDRD